MMNYTTTCPNHEFLHTSNTIMKKKKKKLRGEKVIPRGEEGGKGRGEGSGDDSGVTRERQSKVEGGRNGARLGLLEKTCLPPHA